MRRKKVQKSNCEKKSSERAKEEEEAGARQKGAVKIAAVQNEAGNRAESARLA